MVCLISQRETKNEAVSNFSLNIDKQKENYKLPEFDFDFNIEDLDFRQPPHIPQEWLTMVCKLHPVTAAIVWQVLTTTITAATITLAQSSPDRGRFNLISIVASGNPDECEEVTQLARMEVDEILFAVVPGYRSRQILQ